MIFPSKRSRIKDEFVVTPMKYAILRIFFILVVFQSAVWCSRDLIFYFQIIFWALISAAQLNWTMVVQCTAFILVKIVMRLLEMRKSQIAMTHRKPISSPQTNINVVTALNSISTDNKKSISLKISMEFDHDSI